MGNPQVLAIQVGQLTGERLELFPGLDTITHRVRQSGRHVITRRLAFLASEADVQVRPMLLALLATAVWLTAGAVGLGQRSEDHLLSQLGHLAPPLLLRLLDAPNR
jgi:hypothetical protein